MEIINFTANHILAKETEEDGFMWDALELCQLEDLGYRGYPFTWSNKRLGDAHTKVQLDRAVATKEWIEKFQTSTVTHLSPHASDHLPIIIQIQSFHQKRRKRDSWFKFEESWLLWDDCETVVQDAWNKQKIGVYGAELKVWSIAKIEPDVVSIKQLQNWLDSLNRAETTEDNKTKYLEVSKRLDDLLLKYEIYWAQRRRNHIKSIKNAQGKWVEEVEDVAMVATDYFDNLFCVGSCDQMEECLNAVPSKVTLDMQEMLSNDFSVEEIKVAFFQMGPAKAPGPDMKNLEKMADFKLISLCNAIYKIISKSAFVPSSLITDNILVAYKTLRTMHSKKRGKKGALALNLDINKAYNGPYGNILPSMGLCQGDPLSPYLFQLCVEGFTSLLAKAKLEGKINGASICRRAPKISNLLFANDSLLFCRATQNEVVTTAEILQTYANASGQSINLEKSSVYFSSNTLGRQKMEMMRILGVKEVFHFETYLRLPTLIGRAKYHTFSNLKDRVWKKLQGWMGMLLSKAGKEVLIKAMAQSIPTYTMSVFQLPLKLCDELNALCAKFWWGQVENERKIHWKSWDKLSSSKKEGGMGFCDLRAFNLTMLAKQGLEFFSRCDYLQLIVRRNSFIWRSIMAALPVLKSGYCWRVGNGFSIKVLRDRWIPNHLTNSIHATNNGMKDLLVSNLIDQDLHWWRSDYIMTLFQREDAEAICKIPLSKRYVVDSIVSIHNKNGRFIVKSAYKVAKEILRGPNWAECSSDCAGKEVWAALWKLHILNKIKAFKWRACHDISPTQMNLKKRRIITEDACPICTRCQESALHALRDCVVAQDVWARSIKIMQKSAHGQTDILQLMEYLMDRLALEDLELVLVLAWLIWNQRNRRATNYLEEFRNAQRHLTTDPVL
ncbi:hypothetical protein ACB092_08G063900 [Castanea dentata]